MSMKLIDDLVDNLEDAVDFDRESAHVALMHLNRIGALREEGEEVHPGDLQKGDRYRVEYDYVHHNRLEVLAHGDEPTKKLVRRHTVEQILGKGSPEPVFFSGDSTENERYFLLERAEPELPTTWGTVAVFRPRTDPGPAVQAVYGRDGKWRGIDLCLDADLMAQRYRLVEVLS